MDDPHQQPLPPKESLAELGPSPYVISDEQPAAFNFKTNLLLFGAAGAGALFLLSATMTPCVGATHSTRLQWEQRQLQIEQAAREAQSPCE